MLKKLRILLMSISIEHFSFFSICICFSLKSIKDWNKRIQTSKGEVTCEFSPTFALPAVTFLGFFRTGFSLDSFLATLLASSSVSASVGKGVDVTLASSASRTGAKVLTAVCTSDCLDRTWTAGRTKAHLQVWRHGGGICGEVVFLLSRPDFFSIFLATFSALLRGVSVDERLPQLLLGAGGGGSASSPCLEEVPLSAELDLWRGDPAGDLTEERIHDQEQNFSC